MSYGKKVLKNGSSDGSISVVIKTSATFKYRAQIDWNNSKIISPLISLCSGWHQHGRSGATGTLRN